MNLTVVIGILLSAAMVLAKKPLKELTGVEAAAKLEADKVIAQAANGTNLIIRYTKTIEYPIRRKF